MSRRTVSSLLASVLLGVLFFVAATTPVPYVTMSPGPTVDVYAAGEDGTVVSVDGARTYPTKGELRVTTVSVTSPGQDLALVDALAAWFDRTRAVYPRDVIYPPDQTAEEQRQESSVQMTSSQDVAVAVALQELGYDVPVQTEVRAVSTGMPADGKIRVGDIVLEVNGVRVRGVSQVARLVQRTGARALLATGLAGSALGGLGVLGRVELRDSLLPFRFKGSEGWGYGGQDYPFALPLSHFRHSDEPRPVSAVR